MGLAANQARLNVLTARKSDLEYRLILISNQTQRLTAEKSSEINEKAKALNTYMEGNDQKVSFTETVAFMNYEKAMNELEAAQNRLDVQQKSLETELKAVSSEQEEVSKLVESNTKKSFAYFN